ncbi:MAG: hypothetical protein IJA74_05570 [Oscillospiraceae bacterium]|nr:hypothetical protein [Oscillospiraceae bacterium]
MKKLSVLIALVLCVTIGGVYAAWTYTNPDADITDRHFNQLITISAATQEGAAGEYAIETNITGMSIDQKGTNSESVDFHKAVLNYTTSDGETPYIKFTLKLKENTGSDIFSTLDSTYSIAVIGTQNYNGDPIFSDNNPNTEEIVWVYDDANDIYYYEITDMATEFTLNDIVLPSKADHTAFTTALGNAVLEVKISDGITA